MISYSIFFIIVNKNQKFMIKFSKITNFIIIFLLVLYLLLLFVIPLKVCHRNYIYLSFLFF